MAEYEIRILDRFGVTKTIIPTFDSLTYTRGALAARSCTVEMPLDHQSIKDPLVLQPWAREILLRRREKPGAAWVVAHDGPIISREYDVVTGKATFTAGGVKSFLRKRAGGYLFYQPGIDLKDLAELIIARAQDRGLTPVPAGSTFFTTYSNSATGVTVDFDTTGQNIRRYDDILDEYASANPGFDYDFVTTYTPGTRTRVFHVYYPKQGADVDTPLILGSSLTSLTVTADGDRAATHYDVYGPPKGSATLRGNTFVTDPVINIYTRLEEAEVRSDVDDITQLRALSLEQLRLRTPPIELVSGSYKVSAATPWRFASFGDTVLVKARRGPVQINARHRIVNEEVTVSSGGSETVALQFNDPVVDPVLGSP